MNSTGSKEIPEEIWADINGKYNGLYQVSSIGRVRGLDRVTKGHPVEGKILSIYQEKGKYCSCGLYFSGKRKFYTVHRLMAVAFIPNPENKPQVNHKNGNKFDNRLENLEWATPSENTLHAYENKLAKPVCGEKHGNTNFKNADIKRIRSSKLPIRELMIIYQVSHATIYRIKFKKQWKHV